MYSTVDGAIPKLRSERKLFFANCASKKNLKFDNLEILLLNK